MITHKEDSHRDTPQIRRRARDGLPDDHPHYRIPDGSILIHLVDTQPIAKARD